VTENDRFELVFAKTGSINAGTEDILGCQSFFSWSKVGLARRFTFENSGYSWLTTLLIGKMFLVCSPYLLNASNFSTKRKLSKSYFVTLELLQLSPLGSILHYAGRFRIPRYEVTFLTPVGVNRIGRLDTKSIENLCLT
jgi:hypothetical protein